MNRKQIEIIAWVALVGSAALDLTLTAISLVVAAKERSAVAGIRWRPGVLSGLLGGVLAVTKLLCKSTAD